MMIFSGDDINESISNLGSSSLASSSLTTFMDDFHFPQQNISSIEDPYSQQYYQIYSNWSETTSANLAIS
ncbi:unnamed protein product, partial [Rotaria magnacalcarata]